MTHHLRVPSLAELKKVQQGNEMDRTISPHRTRAGTVFKPGAETQKNPNMMEKLVPQELKPKAYLPHQCHHIHIGWTGSQAANQRSVGRIIPSNNNTALEYGYALDHTQDFSTTKHTLRMKEPERQGRFAVPTGTKIPRRDVFPLGHSHDFAFLSESTGGAASPRRVASPSRRA